MPLDKKYVEAYKAILCFIEDLCSTFEEDKEASPLKLYGRLTEKHIGLSDEKALMNSVNGFVKFLDQYENFIRSGETNKIPRNAIIPYGKGDRIYIEIGKFLSEADKETKSIISQHLLTISIIINPDEEKIKDLEKSIQTLKTPKKPNNDDFMSDIMNRAKESMKGGDISNPGAAIATLFSSGVITDMITGLQNGMSDGSLDLNKMMAQMQGIVSDLQEDKGSSKVEEVE